MKVLLPKDYKKYFTVEEYEIAREIIKTEKEDASTAKDMAEYAVREALKNDDLCYLEEILEAKAEVCKNILIVDCDIYFEGSKLMDIYISGVARVSFGYLEFGAYLSDIWETGAREYKVYTTKYVKEEK
jgi:hypothetical protein